MEAASYSWPRDIDGISEPARCFEPHPHRRPADRRRAVASWRSRPAPSARPGRSRLVDGSYSRSGRARGRLPLRIVRRHVPACRHRSGHVVRAEAPDCRRADHRARCHDASDHHGSDARPRARRSHDDDPHNSRSAACHGVLRPYRGDACRPRGRNRIDDRDLFAAAPSIYRGVDHFHAGRGDATRRVVADPRRHPRSAPAAAALPFRRAVRTDASMPASASRCRGSPTKPDTWWRAGGRYEGASPHRRSQQDLSGRRSPSGALETTSLRTAALRRRRYFVLDRPGRKPRPRG